MDPFNGAEEASAHRVSRCSGLCEVSRRPLRAKEGRLLPCDISAVEMTAKLRANRKESGRHLWFAAASVTSCKGAGCPADGAGCAARVLRDGQDDDPAPAAELGKDLIQRHFGPCGSSSGVWATTATGLRSALPARPDQTVRAPLATVGVEEAR